MEGIDSQIENNTDKCKILTVYSKDDIILPTNDTKINVEDSIAILVKSKYLDEIRNYFTIF